ncbi:MAG: hypothetical protein MRZ62_07185 [Brachyspira sp.]|nr:hypothetical protein [Brachyspira sp.]
MNYFEILNKCLVELNYKQVNSFSELTKNEHEKLKNLVNIINKEICLSEKWNFLLRTTTLSLPKNTGQIKNTVQGKIATVMIDGKIFKYYDNFEKFFTNSQPQGTYTSFNDMLLFPIFNKNKEIEIIYYTSNSATSKEGDEKTELEEETDKTLIPTVFAEPLLVYGACMRLKGNPQHVRFNYWYGMYKDALSNMKAKLAVDANTAPVVNLFRT